MAVIEVLSAAAAALTLFLCTLYLIAIGAGMLSSYYMRTKSPRQED